jgi:hypothetical protein
MTIFEINERIENFSVWKKNAKKNADKLKLISGLKNIEFEEDSIDIIENFIHENLTYESVFEKNNHVLIDCLVCFIGELYKKYFKIGDWQIDIINKNNFYYNIPTIILPNIEFPPISPYNIILSNLYWKKKGGVKKVFYNVIDLLKNQSY